MARRLALLALVGLVPTVVAQPKPAPQWPTLATPTNLGIAPGTHELTLTGARLAGATGVLCSTPGITFTIPPKQTDAAKFKVSATVAKDVPVGVHTIRVLTPAGVSEFRPLCVDPLPEVAEKDGNTKRETAQPVPVPSVVTGAVTAEAADYFKFKVTAGQTLTVEAVARRIGSPLDPVLVLHDAATGRELPGVYADDTPGLQSDARITHTFKAAGEIVVELRDATYRGGADFVYRLRIGEFPGAMTAFPLAATAGETVKVSATGPDAGRVTAVDLKIEAPATYFTPRIKDGLPGWAVPVRASSHPEMIEKEPNDDPKTANRLPVPGGVSAVFGAKNDKDHFVVAGKKGQKLVAIAHTAEIGAPTEVYLRVLDAKGAEVAKSDPTKPVARAEFTPAADGDVVIAAEHLNYLYGPTEVYHLVVRPVGPDFDVTFGLDRFAIAPGGAAVLPVVTVTRTNGFNGPIALKLEGVPGVTGTLTIPQTANPTPQAPLYLSLVADEKAKVGGSTASVVATGGAVSKQATAVDVARAGLGGLAHLPPEMPARLAAAVIEKTPFTVDVKLDGTKATATVTRTAGFDDEIKIDALVTPPGVTVKPGAAAKGKTTAVIELTAKDAKAGTLIVRATAKVGGVDYEVVGRPIEWTPPPPAKAPPPPPKK